MPGQAVLSPWKKLEVTSISGIQNHHHPTSPKRPWGSSGLFLDYIGADDPDAAARFGKSLLNHSEILAAFPHLGIMVSQRRNVRSLLHTPIRITTKSMKAEKPSKSFTSGTRRGDRRSSEVV